MGARGASEAVGRHAEVRGEEPAQVACRDAEPGAELRLGPAVEGAAENQLHRAAHELRPRPVERVGRAVRPAAQARAVPRGLGGGGEPVLRHVLGQRAGAALGPAVDARRRDRRERFHSVRDIRTQARRRDTFGHALEACPDSAARRPRQRGGRRGRARSHGARRARGSRTRSRVRPAGSQSSRATQRACAGASGRRAG